MAITAANLITYQPVKGIWVLGAIIINAIKLPFWLLYYSIPSTRPHPQWSLKQTIGTLLLRTAVYHIHKIQMSTPLVLSPTSKEQAFLVTIAPSTTPGVYGGICTDAQIKPATICGYWYPSAYNHSEDKNKKIVLHFHGGGYVIGDCRPSDSGYAASLLTKHIGKTIVVSYRLASNANGRFPAALQDAISALHYLRDLGVEYSNIVVSGDSAGGHLSLALLRHLALADAPGPVAALLWSPWVDAAKTRTPELTRSSPQVRTDCITPEFAAWASNSTCPEDGPFKMNSKWISPLSEPFHTKTPLWINGNSQEVMFEPISEFADKMTRIKNNKVRFHNEEIANHDILLVANVTGFEKEAENAAKLAAEWIGEL